MPRKRGGGLGRFRTKGQTLRFVIPKGIRGQIPRLVLFQKRGYFEGTGSEVCIRGVVGYYKAFLGSKVSLE